MSAKPFPCGSQMSSMCPCQHWFMSSKHQLALRFHLKNHYPSQSKFLICPYNRFVVICEMVYLKLFIGIKVRAKNIRWNKLWVQRSYVTDAPVVRGRFYRCKYTYPDSKVHGANMGPTWVLSAPDGPHVGPIYFAIRVAAPLAHIFRKRVSYGWYFRMSWIYYEDDSCKLYGNQTL